MHFKKRFALILASLTISSAVMAKENTLHDFSFKPTIMLGYEQGKLHDFGNLRGPNLSFVLEADDYPIGFMGSVSVLKNYWDYKDKYSRAREKKILPPPRRNAEYYSAMIGPTIRLNEVVSLYALAGISHTDVKLVTKGSPDSKASSNDFAWGAGAIANITDNLTIRAGYEGSKAAFSGKKHKMDAFVVSVGYRF